MPNSRPLQTFIRLQSPSWIAHGLRLFLVRLGCGFCRTLPDSAEEELGFCLFSELAK